jgi:hypothetical protein
MVCLGPRVVEFAGLTDNDRAGTDNHYFLDIVTSGHIKLLLGITAIERRCIIKQAGFIKKPLGVREAF